MLLKEHAPNASILGLMEIPDGFDEEEHKVPSLIMLAEEYKQINDITIITDMSHFVDFITDRLTPEVQSDIASLQQGTDDWFGQRKGRLTGSKIGTVVRFRMTNKSDNSLVKSVLENSSTSTLTCQAINYGNTFEPVARTLYLAEKEKEGHRKLTVTETGLVIDQAIPFIGASPDGIVSCTCCGKSIIEIKCCFSRQNERAMDIAKSGTYHVLLDDNGKFALKETSPWYDQMMAEMAVTGSDSGDFVLFTNLGIEFCKVTFSPERWSEITRKCNAVYEKFILPKL